MCSNIISYFSIFGIFYSLDRYSTKGEKCVSVMAEPYTRKIDTINCGETESIFLERVWIDRRSNCVFNHAETIDLSNEPFGISCIHPAFCEVKYYNKNNFRSFKHIRFQCKDCIVVHAFNSARITCPANRVIRIASVRFYGRICAAIRHTHNTEKDNDLCKDIHTCLLSNPNRRIASVYYQCEDGTNIKDTATETHGGYYIPGDDSSTETYGSYDLPVDETSMETHGDPNYAAIVGGIVGAVVLIICITVGVFLLRRRNCTESSKEHVVTSLNPSYDPTHVQAEAETNQQGHLMNSADTSYVSTSHAINVDNTTNEESNTYSHIRNAVDDSDVMYDHTIRHNIHDTCDGDYGIAHRRITEDDYDVSGNYRRSPSKEADPVYN
ncbi:uncharacterized protein LOC143051332 [Mytilus galloprovincialis]|uniref:uncharacterized protein LOC143051332 n=1 Tax=Mytilus galloprovincialis TaxID=29158 RepID=UPI003F7BA4E2